MPPNYHFWAATDDPDDLWTIEAVDPVERTVEVRRDVIGVDTTMYRELVFLGQFDEFVAKHPGAPDPFTVPRSS